jgi:putative MFS transporter
MTLYPGPPWRFLPTPAVLSPPSSDRSFSPGVRMRAVGLCNTLGRTATILMPFLAVFLFRMHGVKGVLILMIGLLVLQILVVHFYGIEPRMRRLEEIQ